MSHSRRIGRDFNHGLHGLTRIKTRERRGPKNKTGKLKTGKSEGEGTGRIIYGRMILPSNFLSYFSASIFLTSSSRSYPSHLCNPWLNLGYNDLERIGGGLGGEGDGSSGLFQRKLMGNKAADIELAAEDQAGNFLLQKKIGGIAADEVFFIHADFGEGHWHFVAPGGVGEEEHLPAATDETLGFADHGVGGDGNHCGVEAWSVERWSVQRWSVVRWSVVRGAWSVVCGASGRRLDT